MSEFDDETETTSMAEAEATPETPPETTGGEKVFCAVSKEMVPIEETVEVERKKGEVLRIHQRFKKF